MQAEADNAGEIDHRERIWFFPNKFWQMRPPSILQLISTAA